MATMACVLALAGCGAHGSVPGLPSAGSNTRMLSPNAAPRSIPLIKNDQDKSGFHVQLSVAGTKTQDFLFDTGSGGLWVYANAIANPKNKVRDLHITTHNKYGSGLYYEGELVESTVSFGQGLSIASLPFVSVAKAYCLTASCKKKYGSGSNIIDSLEKDRGLWGTFGADLEPRALSSGTHKGELYNGLFGLSAAWTIFGVTPTAIEASPSTNGLLSIPMIAGPKTNGQLPNGAQSWQRDVRACYAIRGTSTFFSRCLRTLFDTGAAGVMLRSAGTQSIPTLASQHCGTIVVGSNTVTLSAGSSGSRIGGFATGVKQNWNEVKVTAPNPTSSPQVNTGLTFYNRNEIIFDAVHGSISFKHLHPAVRNFVENCGT